MSGFLRQSTASQSRALGPFLDDADGFTPLTGLTIANTDIKIVANGAASANKNSGGGTHRVNGEYGVTWDATDTATVGEMKVNVTVSGALPVFYAYTVLEEAVYDAFYAADALGYVAAAQGIVDEGTAQAATGTTIQLRSAATFADDTLNGMLVGAFGSTQAYWQFRIITDYVGSTDTATVDAWTVTPSGTVTYKVFGSATSATENQGLVDEVWDESLAGHSTAGTSGKALSDSATQTTATAIRAAQGLASANLDTQLSALDVGTDSVLTAIAALNNLSSAGAQSAAAAALSAYTAATAANVSAVPAAVLVAATAAPIASDMKLANGTEVQGDGTTGDKWRSILIP